ncbi:MAG: hypothetical protein COV91_04770 [Candidatus Taylorbacteria bacterium CG11_big_fil_rev_8_21_14_0_20_46_11]|uniref:Uncharacterized protein n=1 Tax=Candidatus Taylorbacteria bacterium CG11_big_fil_rev_8_21_14_0_20_46_11 TaxID=1975025 RepID=A0A2H0KAN1_9BACT|nr:MAG: hypothetical protein COV91_04770 [Candidatus Taylorbacteria bacterium CG11_big_fil_rev_8_21_14_0_20_46_11]
MNWYNITKGQIVTIWVFGMLLWLWFSFMREFAWSEWQSSLFFGLPLILIFYTIGWKNNKKG